MTMRRAPLLFEEATNADGVWTLVVRSSNGVVGHIFRAVGGPLQRFYRDLQGRAYNA
jgi:hypothetical protein